MSGTALRPRHGPAGLLVALLVVAGLVFSYGLGRTPLPRVCTQHAVSAPADAAVIGTATPDAATPDAAAIGAAPAPAGDTAVWTDGPAQAPMHACLCLAVLFTLLLLGLALGPRSPFSRLPARHGWALAPPSAAVSVFVFPPSFQVLRL